MCFHNALIYYAHVIINKIINFTFLLIFLGIINYTVERLQIASAPAEGIIVIDFNGHSSSQIPIDADVQEVIAQYFYA